MSAGESRRPSYAINPVNNGNNPLVGCKFVNTNPFGNLDGVTRQSNGVRVNGWALDPDVATSIPVHVYVDGQPINACMLLAHECAGRAVITIEGLARGDALHPVPRS